MGYKSKTTTINAMKIDRNEFSNPSDVANILNRYFCITSKRIQEEALSKELHSQSSAAFESFVTKILKASGTFKFMEITSSVVTKDTGKLKYSCVWYNSNSVTEGCLGFHCLPSSENVL